MSIRVMVVDDHEVVRAGIRMIIEAESDMHVVGEADSGEGAVELARVTVPDVVIMDVRMGSKDGIAACREVVSANPAPRVLMLTSFGTEEAVLSSLVAGASGFLLKNVGSAEILRAVRALADGQTLLDPAVTQRVTDRLVALVADSTPDELSDLSDREREVLVRVAHGDTNREIAEKLVISPATARNHVSHILEKLALSRRSELAALASRLGLLDADD